MKKGKDLLKSFEYIDDEYLDLVEEMTVKKNKVWWKSGMAAAICFGVLSSASAVAFAANLFGVKDLVISTEKKESVNATIEDKENASEGEHTETVIAADGSEVSCTYEISGEDEKTPVDTNATVDLISLAGFRDSSEAKALKEWYAFCDTYDVDGKIRDEHNYDEPDTWGEDVKLYGVYSDEMAEKLREIAGKYQLKLHTKTDTISYDQFDSFFGGKLLPEGTECFGAYYYEDGSITFDADYCDADESLIDYQLSRRAKGTFDETYLAIGNSEEYVQEQYKTKDGSNVILALSDSKGMIIMDSEKYFTIINIMSEDYGKYEGEKFIKEEFTMDKLKAFADTFNLELLK
ncbi:MAG: hypothetical protein Q4D51_03820 [Eubacteriales bacterium]|nr:hypothetical protein [Eubacteriales bacterium]